MTHHKPHVITNLIDSKGKGSLATTPAHRESSLQGELFNVMRDSIGLVEGRSSLDAILFARSQNHWANYGVWGTHKTAKINQHAKKTWQKGKVLLVDFGTLNIGSEHSMQHPAIVLDDVMNMVVVIPITSEEDGFGNKKTFAPDIESRIIRVSKADARLQDQQRDGSTIQWELKNDSIFLTHQIRLVDKNRIRNPIGVHIEGSFKVLSLSNTPLMKEIEQRVAEYLCTSVYDNYVGLQTEVDEWRKKNEEQEQEIHQLKIKLLELEEFHNQQMQKEVASVDRNSPE